MKFKCDLNADNFNLFFAEQASSMTPGQRENLPPELLSKIFRRDGKVSTQKLNFLQKMYILSKGMGKDIFILMKDPDKGMGVYDFDRFSKHRQEREFDMEQADYYVSKGAIVMSGNELIEYVAHVNGVSVSPAYNYAVKLKNSKAEKMPDYEKELGYIVKILKNYEGNKRKIVTQKLLTVPDLYVLYYLNDGTERGATKAYTDDFKYSFNSSRQQILNAFRKLCGLGYIQKYGEGKFVTYKITAIGKVKLAEVLKKYVLD